MCIIMTQRETLPAEKRSAKASQAAVDKLMAYDRELKSNSYAEAPSFEDGVFGSLFSIKQRGERSEWRNLLGRYIRPMHIYVVILRAPQVVVCAFRLICVKKGDNPCAVAPPSSVPTMM